MSRLLYGQEGEEGSQCSQPPKPPTATTSDVEEAVDEAGNEAGDEAGDFAEEAGAGAGGKEHLSNDSLPFLSDSVKRKKKAITDQLATQQEDDFCEWYKEHTFFYDKTNKEYRNSDMKKAVITAMARSFHLMYDNLQKYFASLRRWCCKVL